MYLSIFQPITQTFYQSELLNGCVQVTLMILHGFKITLRTLKSPLLRIQDTGFMELTTSQPTTSSRMGSNFTWRDTRQTQTLHLKGITST